MNDNLTSLRKEIDELDNKLLEIIAMRFSIVKKIGEIKKINKLSILDEKRRQEVLKKWISNSKKYKLPKDIAESIYNILHMHSLKMEDGKK